MKSTRKKLYCSTRKTNIFYQLIF